MYNINITSYFELNSIFYTHKKNYCSGGIRTHASKETGALKQCLRPLGHPF